MTTLRARPKSEKLLLRYRELRDAGAHPMERREAYNAWFRQRCAEGNSPSALLIHSLDESERFWARTVPGLDGHLYWTGADYFRRNGGRDTKPQRWAWKATHGELSNYVTIESTCGMSKCVNVDHLRIQPRVTRRSHYPDSKAIGKLQVLALQLGGTPTVMDWDAASPGITASGMVNRFGSWGAFCRLAGLDASRSNHAVDLEVCREAVHALAARVGHAPTVKDWDDNHAWLKERKYPTSATTIRNKLGGPFTAAVAGVLSEEKAA